MKKLFVTMLMAIAVACSALGVASVAVADAQPTTITTAEQFLAMNGTDGDYVLGADITLPDGKYVDNFHGTLNGNGYSITINNAYGVFRHLGITTNTGDMYEPAEVENFTVKGTVKGNGNTAYVGGLAANAIGLVKNVRVETNVSSNAYTRIGGFANCVPHAGKKLPLSIVDSTFAGTVTMLQGYTTQINYTYFGLFMGYNGGAFGTGYLPDGTTLLKDCIAEYTFTIPTSETARVQEIEFFNDNPSSSEKDSYYTSTVDGDNTVYTLNAMVNMNRVDVSSVNDEGIMANYGTPSVRFKIEDVSEEKGYSYRYIDGFNRAECKYETTFSAESFNKMYKYVDISDLTVVDLHTSTGTGSAGNVSGSITSKYATVQIETSEQFESFARMINSAVPASFKDKNGTAVNLSVLDSLCIKVELIGDVDLTIGDENGNKSEFYGIGKQEFFPFRGSLNGNDHTIKVDIDAPNGYCIGIFSVLTDMAGENKVENLVVEGSILGKTKVGVVGYYDMVCNDFVSGSDLKIVDVINNADVTGYVCVGGLLGATCMGKDAMKAFFENSENNGDITLLNNGRYAGGIVGAAGGYYNVAGISAKNVQNTGNVIAGSGTNYVGGIAGILSDDLSQLLGVTSTGTVTCPGSYTGDLVGWSGVIYGDISGGIGKYNVVSVNDINNGLSFNNTEMTSSYGKTNRITLENKVKLSANYKINLVFVNKATNEKTVVEKYFLGYYDATKMEVGEYDVNIVLTASEGYYNLPDTVPEEGVVLKSTATLTVEKAKLEYAFGDVTTAYTGETLDYLEIAENMLDENKVNYSVPEGGSFNVEYYKNGSKVDAVNSAGAYEVKITLEGNDLFNSRYDYSTETTIVNMNVLRTLIVTVNNVSVEKGKQAQFSVTAVSADGEAYNNYSALGLTYVVKGFGTSDTTMLPVKEYVVTVSGNSSVEGFSTIEYKEGKLTITNPVQPTPPQSSDNGGESEKKGCGLDLGLTTVLGLAFVAISAVAIKRKQN